MHRRGRGRLYDDERTAFEERVKKLRAVLSIPEGTDQTECQLTLSHLAVKTAVDRHAGTIELVVTHNGTISGYSAART